MIASLSFLSGCANVNIDQSVAKVNQDLGDFTQGQLSLVQTKEQRTALDQAATVLLQTPLEQNDAVRLALMNSPALQAMLAQSWQDAAGAAQSGRIANPVFSFERLRFRDELELGRLLSFGLLDLLTLPQRYGVAQGRIEQNQLRLTRDVVDQMTQVRQAWVKAVAMQQSLGYAQQVSVAAAVSADLAQRLQSVGNLSKLQRARQQVFYADAATQWAAAQQAASATREDLVRRLGLTDEQAVALKLPTRLPSLPKVPRSPEEVSRAASAGRLDIRLARSSFDAAAKAQGLKTLTSLTDIELGVRRNSVFDSTAGTTSAKNGYEISLRLPLFDWGGVQREAMSAQTLAAANQLEAAVRAAGSHLRESYSAYRTAYDVSRHYRDEVVPLRKIIADENVLRYNGMLIGVFELLADTREQINSVVAAIAAEQQFWLADAALQASMMGKPTMATVGAALAGGKGGADGGH